MGVSTLNRKAADEEIDTASLLAAGNKPPPPDAFHLAYIVYFVLGAGFLLPWNAFITGVDYFAYLYPTAQVDRVFAVTYMTTCFVFLLVVIATMQRSSASLRINAGLAIFVLSLLVPPVIDAVLRSGRTGTFWAYVATVSAVALSGVGDALVQGGVIGAAGEMPEVYMQAVCAGTAASGVLVSVMRMITKSLFPQSVEGLRKSANLYFGVSIAVMVICIICYNIADKLPVVQYYKDLKHQAVLEEGEEKGHFAASAWRSSLKDILVRVKWFGFGIFLIYIVTLSIFPGFITADVHSATLKDWYPIILITSYNVFDLVGKMLPAVYVLENENIAVGACIARLLFFPLFLGCLHGPEFFRTEIPVTLLTCLLGLTNGYFTSILMMLAPKSVPIQHSEMAGVAIVLFLVVGLVVGSVVTWFWVI